jgi:hypothetical protein
MGSFNLCLSRYFYSSHAPDSALQMRQHTPGVGMAVGHGRYARAAAGQRLCASNPNVVHLIWIEGSYDMVGVEERVKVHPDLCGEFGPLTRSSTRRHSVRQAFGSTNRVGSRPPCAKHSILPVQWWPNCTYTIGTITKCSNGFKRAPFL